MARKQTAPVRDDSGTWEGPFYGRWFEQPEPPPGGSVWARAYEEELLPRLLARSYLREEERRKNGTAGSASGQPLEPPPDPRSVDGAKALARFLEVRPVVSHIWLGASMVNPRIDIGEDESILEMLWDLLEGSRLPRVVVSIDLEMPDREILRQLDSLREHHGVRAGVTRPSRRTGGGARAALGFQMLRALWRPKRPSRAELAHEFLPCGGRDPKEEYYQREVRYCLSAARRWVGQVKKEAETESAAAALRRIREAVLENRKSGLKRTIPIQRLRTKK